MPYSVPHHVADEVIRLANAGLVIQGAWNKIIDGQNAMCALAAFSPGITEPEQCPADYMPEWLRHLVPPLDDSIQADEVRAFAIGLAERSKRWGVMSDDAWEKVRAGFVTHCITSALEAAEAVQPTPRPAYWGEVQTACGLVLAALRGDGDIEAAAEAAWTAAWTAARAAEAEAEAAARTARATAEAEAASKQVKALFALLDAEISAAEAEHG